MPEQPPKFYKNPAIAAVLSFFWPGLSQIYDGQIFRRVSCFWSRRLFPLGLCSSRSASSSGPSCEFLERFPNADGTDGKPRFSRELEAQREVADHVEASRLN